MDLICPLKEMLRGNKYIVTLTDYFSKWAEAAPPQDKCAIGVAFNKYVITLFNCNIDGILHLESR